MTSISRGHCDNIKVFKQGKSNQIREKSGKNQGICLLIMCGHPVLAIVLPTALALALAAVLAKC